MRRHLRLLAAVVAAGTLIGLVAGCDGRHRHRDRHHGRMHERMHRGTRVPVPAADTRPERADTESQQPSSDRDSIVAGRYHYRRYCASCHGRNRRGDPPMYPSLRDLPDRMSRAEARTVIVNGRRAMPSFSGLTDAEQNALLDYLFTPPEDD